MVISRVLCRRLVPVCAVLGVMLATKLGVTELDGPRHPVTLNAQPPASHPRCAESGFWAAGGVSGATGSCPRGVSGRVVSAPPGADAPGGDR